MCAESLKEGLAALGNVQEAASKSVCVKTMTLQ